MRDAIRFRHLFIVLCLIIPACGEADHQHRNHEQLAESAAAPDSSEVMMPSGDYPPGPYGLAVGDTVDDVSVFTSQDNLFRLSDLHRNDDTQLLLVFATAGWCSRCREHMESLSALHAQYVNAGLHAVVSIHENSNYQPATIRDAFFFRRQYDLPFDVLADTDARFVEFFDAFSPPLIVVIDLKTMVVEHLAESWNYDQMVDLIVAHLYDE
ncbi:MAG: hypothetical protein CMH52_07615 [Myxococcales bacterium]|nr:hypothetical protein [Myxococcales bacterium]